MLTAVVIAKLLESFAVASPKSARQALRESVIRMLAFEWSSSDNFMKGNKETYSFQIPMNNGGF
jgi:hypothetical protein